MQQSIITVADGVASQHQRPLEISPGQLASFAHATSGRPRVDWRALGSLLS